MAKQEQEIREEPGFCCDASLYRVKSELKYRPFKDADECWEEIKKHEPCGWLKSKSGNYEIPVMDVDFTYVGSNTYKYAFDNFTFIDGTPFGVVED